MTQLVVTHNAGFFSCCSVRLERIIAYFRENGSLPLAIDSRGQFQWYRPQIANAETIDMALVYFTRPDPQLVGQACAAIQPYRHYAFNNSDPTLPDIQFCRYREGLNFNILHPIVGLYFQPSVNVMHIQQQLKRFYDLRDLSTKWCAVFYRGNDKAKEMTLPSYSDFLTEMQARLQEDPDIQFLVQSDETEFLESVLQHFPDRCRLFHKHIRHMRRDGGMSVDHINMEDNLYYSLRFLAIITLLSKCHSVICTSGNCAMWICLYRGSAERVYHYHNGEWHK